MHRSTHWFCSTFAILIASTDTEELLINVVILTTADRNGNKIVLVFVFQSCCRTSLRKGFGKLG